MMQFRTRPEASRGIAAVASEPPQPIELRTIEAEFYDALADGADDDAAADVTADGRAAAPAKIESERQSTDPRREPQRDELSPARRLAAPMFIATCLLLGLLTHGADANRLLNLWQQTETPPARAEAAPLFSGAWRQIGRYRDDATSGRDAIPALPPEVPKPIDEPLVHESTAGETGAAIQPAEPLATRPIDTDPGESLFVPIALNVICALPVAFEADMVPPAVQQAALTDLYPYEPWSVRPADAGSVGRAQIVFQAVVTGTRSAGMPLPETQAPAALPPKAVKPKPDSKPAPAKVRPVQASTPAPAPATPKWSQDAFRF